MVDTGVVSIEELGGDEERTPGTKGCGGVNCPDDTMCTYFTDAPNSNGACCEKDNNKQTTWFVKGAAAPEPGTRGLAACESGLASAWKEMASSKTN